MSYSHSSSRSYYSSSSGGGPRQTQVTERKTVIGPDGQPHTETRSYTQGLESGGGGGFGGFASRLGGWIDDGARVVTTVTNEIDKMGLGGNDGGGFFKVRSKPTEARYKKGWGGGSTRSDRYKPPQTLSAKDFKGIKAECLAKGMLFEDPDFEAVDKSIFYSRTPPRPFEWKRPPVSTRLFS
jgi:hypothetical protein